MRRVMCRRVVSTERRGAARAVAPSFGMGMGRNDVTGDMAGAGVGVGLEMRPCEAAARKDDDDDDDDASNDDDIAAMVAGSIASNSMLSMPVIVI